MLFYVYSAFCVAAFGLSTTGELMLRKFFQKLFYNFLNDIII